MTKSVLEGLNPSQKQAVLHLDGPVLVLAGAGSGKTRIITNRIAHLVNDRDVSPSNILAVTFTNKAAGEMKERVEGLVPGTSRKLWIGTFHSICLRILKREIDKLEGFRRDFVIYDEGDQIKLIKECIKSLGYNEKVMEPKFVRSQIDRAKNMAIHPGDEAPSIYQGRVARVFDLYQSELLRVNALDFGDLIAYVLRLFEGREDVREVYRNKFHFILIDEYQDTNKLQYNFIKLLTGERANVFAVGDDNQSIYGWRGADISNILNFPRDFENARVVKLEQNYRSTKIILDASNALISKNAHKHEKRLWTENPGGQKLKYYEASDERDEAHYICEQIRCEISKGGLSYGDFAVFYRTNNQSRMIEEELLRSGVPYTIVGAVGFYSRAEIKNVLAYLKVIANPLDDISLKRIINVPSRGLGKATVQSLEDIARSRVVSVFKAMDIAVDEGIVSKKAVNGLKNFKALLEGFIEYSSAHSVGDVLRRVLEKTGYLETLKGDEERLRNVGEMLNEAAEFSDNRGSGSVQDFLESVILTSDVDNLDEKKGTVALMTMHCAKGLEFPVVFIAGMEENLFPHIKSRENPKQLEEERRLFYVGLTRAKEKIFLTSTSSRRFYGEEKRSTPSRFVAEIPKELLVWESYNVPSPESSSSKGGRGREGSLKRKWTLPAVNRNGVGMRGANGKHSPKGVSLNGGGGLYVVGERVEHQAFGQGIVRNVEGDRDGRKVVIMFPGMGVKTIMETFVGLKKV